MTGRLFKVSSALLSLIMLTACATTESIGPQGMEGAMFAEPLGDYHLRPGDRIEIKFFYNPELNEKLEIGPDGKICLPLLDEILVAGLTTPQADEVLTKSYLKHLENVSINVIVREYAGLKVYVGGEVGRPGFYSLKGSMSVLEAILAAQGFTVAAKPESVIVVRKGPGSRPVSMAVDLRPVLSGEQLENDIYVMPSDIVYVPKTFVAKAGDFVDLYLRRVLFVDAIMQGAGWALGDEWVRSN